MAVSARGHCASLNALVPPKFAVGVALHVHPLGVCICGVGVVSRDVLVFKGGGGRSCILHFVYLHALLIVSRFVNSTKNEGVIIGNFRLIDPSVNKHPIFSNYFGCVAFSWIRNIAICLQLSPSAMNHAKLMQVVKALIAAATSKQYQRVTNLKIAQSLK